MKVGLIPAMLVLALSGCATNQFPVQYTSNPSKANISCNGKSLGYTPQTRYYSYEDLAKFGNKLRLPNCTATWVSGDTQSFGGSGTVIDTAQYPNGIYRNAVRNPDAPNYTIDAQAALNAEQQQSNNQGNNVSGGYDSYIPNAGVKAPTYCYKFGMMVTCNN